MINHAVITNNPTPPIIAHTIASAIVRILTTARLM
jgi:hypothetical protein